MKRLSNASMLGLVAAGLVVGGLLAAVFVYRSQVHSHQGVTWKTFTSPNGMCTGLLPANFGKNVDGLELDVPVDEWGQWVGDMKLAITVLPASLGIGETPADRYESAAIRQAEAWDGYVVKSDVISSAGYEGRHQIINTGPVVFEQHIYIVDDVVIMAVATYPDDGHDRERVKYFLDHFQLVGDEVVDAVNDNTRVGG